MEKFCFVHSGPFRTTNKEYTMNNQVSLLLKVWNMPKIQKPFAAPTILLYPFSEASLIG